MKAVNDGIRFILELIALGAIAYWGWRTGNSTAARLLLAVGGVVLVAVVWGVFRSESDALVEVPTAVRVVIEVADSGRLRRHSQQSAASDGRLRSPSSRGSTRS